MLGQEFVLLRQSELLVPVLKLILRQVADEVNVRFYESFGPIGGINIPNIVDGGNHARLRHSALVQCFERGVGCERVRDYQEDVQGAVRFKLRLEHLHNDTEYQAGDG